METIIDYGVHVTFDKKLGLRRERTWWLTVDVDDHRFGSYTHMTKPTQRQVRRMVKETKRGLKRSNARS